MATSHLTFSFITWWNFDSFFLLKIKYFTKILSKRIVKYLFNLRITKEAVGKEYPNNIYEIGKTIMML